METTTQAQAQVVEFVPHKKQAEIFTSRKRIIIAIAGIQSGKGLVETETVLTPKGYVPILELKKGDIVFDRNGEETKVVDIFKRGYQNCYRFFFDDSSTIDVDEDHLWIMFDPHQRKEHLLSTKQLITTHRFFWNKKNKAFIPQIKPIKFNKKDHIISPYILGVLLGDGGITDVCRVTMLEEDIIKKVKQQLPDNLMLKKVKGENYDYSIVEKNPKRDKGGHSFNLFIRELKRLKLYGKKSEKKFIPDEYKFDSIENRVELLRGLMDTDGYIKKNKEITFYSTSFKLAEDVKFLVESLGGKARIRYKRNSFLGIYMVYVNSPFFNPFYLKRKADKYFIHKHKPVKILYKIEPIGRKKTICIKVDSKTETFIAKNQILTHNTTAGIYWSQLQAQSLPDKNGLICGLSHDQLNNVIIEKFFSIFPSYKKYFIKKEKTLYLPTGGKIFFRPLEDPKYIEGITAHWAWIDEGDLISYKAYIYVRGRLGSTGGRLLITSSLTDGGWIGEYAEKMGEGQDIDVISWKSIDNPAFSRTEWEALKKEIDPSIFKRRYEAQFSRNSGRVYSLFDFEKDVKDSFEAGEVADKSFIGFDWGWNDPTAIVVVTLTNLKNVYVVEDFAVEHMTLDLIKRVVDNFKKRYKISAFYADPSNKQYLKEVEKVIHSSIIPAERDIFLGVNRIKNLIYQNRFFVLSKCKNVIRELKNYRYVESLKGLTDEIEDSNNHTLDAIRYVISSYPIPQRHAVEKAAPVLSPFWIRKTQYYKKLLDKLNNKSYTDNEYGISDFFIE